MDKIKLDIIGMSYSQSQSGAYALILGETGGKRRLPIIIGGFEAQSIAIELEKMKPARPLTHDLFKSFAETFFVSVREVVINKFIEGVFHAQLVCVHDNKEFYIDSRTSDAVALSLRFNCPIYTYDRIMSEAGIVVEDKPEKEPAEPETGKKSQSKKNIFTKYNLEELNKLLKWAVEKEDYERASKIRDEINKRQGKTDQS